MAGCLLPDIEIAQTGVLGMCLFQAIKVERCTLSHKCLCYLRGEETTVIGRMVAEKEFDSSVLLHHNKYTTVDHQVDICA